MGCCGDIIGKIHRRRMKPDRYKTCDMGHVDHDLCADIFGDVSKSRKIYGSRVGRSTYDNKFWFMFLSKFFYLHEIDLMCFRVDTIRYYSIEKSRKVNP